VLWHSSIANIIVCFPSGGSFSNSFRAVNYN
jgi:hypothetical protein